MIGRFLGRVHETTLWPPTVTIAQSQEQCVRHLVQRGGTGNDRHVASFGEGSSRRWTCGSAQGLHACSFRESIH